MYASGPRTGTSRDVKVKNTSLNPVSLLKIKTKEYTTKDKYSSIKKRIVYELTLPILKFFYLLLFTAPCKC